MYSKSVMVVGDIFKNIADAEQVMTYSQILNKIEQHELPRMYLHIEQGVSEEQVKALQQKITEKKQKHLLTMRSYYDYSQRCAKVYTHKQQDCNTLISEPTKVDDYTYFADLMIDGNCADLSDHVTGEHLQGMLFIEAARQMTLAVTEKYFIDKAYRGQFDFVTKGCESKYLAYAFPVQTDIKYQILNTIYFGDQHKEYTVRISFFQDEQVVSEVNFIFSTEKKETAYVNHLMQDLKLERLRGGDHVSASKSLVAA